MHVPPPQPALVATEPPTADQNKSSKMPDNKWRMLTTPTGFRP
jgi:hypothetical protein